MRTRRISPARRAALTLAALALWPAGRGETEPQIVSRLAVRRMEMAHRLGGSSLLVRLHLETGQAMDFETSEPLTVDSLLAMAQAFASQGAHLFAEIENNRVRGVQISVP
jgi:hypothetical protein